MSSNESPSMPQIADSLLSRTALGVLLLGAANAGSALGYLLGEDVATLADRARMVLAVAMVALVLPVLLRFLRARRSGLCDLSESDSYLSQVFARASVFAFTVTFLLTVALEATAGTFFAGMPTEFFLNVILAVSLWVLGGAFFFLTRGDDADEDA